MVAVAQPYGLLWLGYTVSRCVHLPDGLPLAVDFLDVAFTACDEQVAFREFLHRPRKETIPSVHFLAMAVVFMDAAQCHVGDKQGAALGEPCIAELSVNGTLLVGGQFKFTNDMA